MMTMMKKIRFLDQQKSIRGKLNFSDESERIFSPGGAEWIMGTEINFFVSDDSNVPPSKRHNLHSACLASRDWIFPHLRRSHAQDLAVSK